MSEILLNRARSEASEGNWLDAYSLFAQVDETGLLTGDDETLFADVAYAAGHLDVTVEVLERVYFGSLRAGDSARAAFAATRVAMHLVFDSALLSPVRGWIRRADELVREGGESGVDAWLAVVRNYERMLSGDFESAHEWALRAIELGSAYDPGAAAIGRIAEARSQILGGKDVQSGIDQLNSAAMASLAGGLDPLTTGIVYCELVCALQALGLYDLADEWTTAMEQWRRGNAVGSIHGRCRVHRAEILRLRGSLADAEDEALRACAELRPYLRRELGWPLTELGRIRLLKGDLEGAEQAFLEAYRRGWDPQPGLARLYLARGDAALAAASIRDALENPMKVPSKEMPPNSELRLAPLLEAQVEIAAAAGDLERARWGAEELQKVAERFGSKALRGNAAIAQGTILLLENEPAKACRLFESGVSIWSDVGAPYETARARLRLAQAHRRNGSEARARLELQAGRQTFEQIGASFDAEMTASAVRQPAGGGPRSEKLPPPTTEMLPRNVPSNEFRREGEYWSISFMGQTVRLHDLKGLRYLARLLQDPGRDFLALDLVSLEHHVEIDDRRNHADLSADGFGDAGDVLDSRAKQAYERRLAEIEDDIEDARAMGDHQRQLQAETERDILSRELARAVGLGGRKRRQGSPSERARVSVTRAVRHALKRICEHHPDLGEHLSHSIRTGTYCAYRPDPRLPAHWVTDIGNG